MCWNYTAIQHTNLKILLLEYPAEKKYGFFTVAYVDKKSGSEGRRESAWIHILYVIRRPHLQVPDNVIPNTAFPSISNLHQTRTRPYISEQTKSHENI
jgi:hypothetical protein